MFATLAVASALGATSVVVAASTPASADQISDAQAQAAAISAKLNATEAQIQTLTGQVNSADYKLAQLQSQIAANQAEVAKDQHLVAKDSHQLEVQAIADYTSAGTSNTATQLFTSNVNTSGIRSEYASIAAGNVTSTIDRLHTAQAQLSATQSSLEQQRSQAQATHDQLVSAQSQASALASQDQTTLDSVNAQIQQLVQQQQAAAAAAAAAAAKAAVRPEGPGRTGGPGHGGRRVLGWRWERGRTGFGRLVGGRGHRQLGTTAPVGSGCRRSRRGRREPGRRPLRLGR